MKRKFMNDENENVINMKRSTLTLTSLYEIVIRNIIHLLGPLPIVKWQKVKLKPKHFLTEILLNLLVARWRYLSTESLCDTILAILHFERPSDRFLKILKSLVVWIHDQDPNAFQTILVNAILPFSRNYPSKGVLVQLTPLNVQILYCAKSRQNNSETMSQIYWCCDLARASRYEAETNQYGCIILKHHMKRTVNQIERSFTRIFWNRFSVWSSFINETLFYVDVDLNAKTSYHLASTTCAIYDRTNRCAHIFDKDVYFKYPLEDIVHEETDVFEIQFANSFLLIQMDYNLHVFEIVERNTNHYNHTMFGSVMGSFILIRKRFSKKMEFYPNAPHEILTRPVSRIIAHLSLNGDVWVVIQMHRTNVLYVYNETFGLVQLHALQLQSIVAVPNQNIRIITSAQGHVVLYVRHEEVELVACSRFPIDSWTADYTLGAIHIMNHYLHLIGVKKSESREKEYIQFDLDLRLIVKRERVDKAKGPLLYVKNRGLSVWNEPVSLIRSDEEKVCRDWSHLMYMGGKYLLYSSKLRVIVTSQFKLENVKHVEVSGKSLWVFIQAKDRQSKEIKLHYLDVYCNRMPVESSINMCQLWDKFF